MPTVTDFTKAYGVQPNTIRHWSSNFADFLSPGANPEKGQRRRYDRDDAEVIALIAAMRQEHESYESIRAALAAGDRGQWPPDDHQAAQDDAGEAQPGEGASFPLVVQLTAKAANLEGELKATVSERDRLIEEKNKLENRLSEMTERALRAETIIGVERLGRPPETPAETNVNRESESGGAAAETPPAAPVKLSSWQRFRRRIAGRG